MEQIFVIKHKWDNHVYEIQDMMKFVQNNIISKKDFFDITRYNYDGVKKVKGKFN